MVSHQPDIGFLDFGCHSLQVRGWRLGQHVPWWSAHNSKVPKYFLSLDIAYSLFLITYLHLSVFCDHFQDPHFLLKQSLPNVFLVQGYLNQLSHFRLSYHLTGFWTWHFGSWAPVETDDMRIPMWNQNEILIWDDTQHSGNHIRIHAVTRINFSVWQRGENINLLVPCYFSSIWGHLLAESAKMVVLQHPYCWACLGLLGLLPARPISLVCFLDLQPTSKNPIFKLESSNMCSTPIAKLLLQKLSCRNFLHAGA